MASSSSPVGRTFGGRFRVTELLGEGGMATVYRGVAEDDGSPVAIKLMSEDLTKSEPFVKRFLREAKTAASLHHRSTVRIFDFGIEDRTPYIVMELIEGAELVHILHHEGRLTEARTVRILAQVCSALAVAHDLGIVHRDLKPENIMLMREPGDPNADRVKILDFGIAKILTPEMVSEDSLPVSSQERLFSSNAPELTTMGMLVGTPEYMAPEQLRGEAVDARTDLYACGLLLFELLTGKVPLVGSTWVETATLRNTTAAPKLTELIPAADAKLEALIASTIDFDRAKRPSSARQMQEQLIALQADLANVLLPVVAPKQPAKGGTVRMPPPPQLNTLPSPSQSPITLGAARSEPVPSVEPAPSSPQASSSRVKFHNRSDWDVQGETFPGPGNGPAPPALKPIRIIAAQTTLPSPDEPGEPPTAPSPAAPMKVGQIVVNVLFLLGVLVVVAVATAFLLRR